MFISIVSFCLLVGVIYLFILCKMNKNLSGKFPTKYAIPVMLLFVIGILHPFEVVKAGSKGVMLTLGKVTNIVNPGLAWKLPIFQDIVHVTTQPIQIEQKIEVGPGGAITKDNQTVGLNMVYFFKYKSDQIKSVYQDYGLERLKSIITNSGIECFKTEIGLHAIFDIPVNQAKIQNSVINNLRMKLSNYPIDITDLKIINFDWSDEFDKQIQSTMHSAQEVKKKEQELLVTEQEAQKLVKQATAEKEALITKAEGERGAAILMAEAKSAEGEGIRNYNKSIQANMSQEIEFRKLEIEKIKAEKWNGEYVSTNNYTPIPIQNGSLLGK
jgi:regulator of protease activity HflC (stomatin/prohibitin superfamily)